LIPKELIGFWNLLPALIEGYERRVLKTVTRESDQNENVAYFLKFFILSGEVQRIY